MVFYTFVADGSCAPSGINREVQCTMRPDTSGPRTRIRAEEKPIAAIPIKDTHITKFY